MVCGLLFGYWFCLIWTSLVAQTVKNLPAVQETQIQSLCREDPLEKGVVTHSSILAWRIPWTEKPVGYSPWDRIELDSTERRTLSLFFVLALPLAFH